MGQYAWVGYAFSIFCVLVVRSFLACSDAIHPLRSFASGLTHGPARGPVLTRSGLNELQILSGQTLAALAFQVCSTIPSTLSGA
jgi:hypothetical protein